MENQKVTCFQRDELVKIPPSAPGTLIAGKG
jgi:hypothetical protein